MCKDFPATVNYYGLTVLLLSRRDLHMEFHESFHVPNWESRVLACKDDSKLPGWLGFGQYVMASLFCLTVPYRIKFANLCYDIPEYVYIKRFYAPGRTPIATPVAVVNQSGDQSCTAGIPYVDPPTLTAPFLFLLT